LVGWSHWWKINEVRFSISYVYPFVLCFRFLRCLKINQPVFFLSRQLREKEATFSEVLYPGGLFLT